MNKTNKEHNDYGADPLGNGMHRMVPSGDIVDLEERMRRLPLAGNHERSPALIGAYNSMQVEAMQGGKLRN